MDAKPHQAVVVLLAALAVVLWTTFCIYLGVSAAADGTPAAWPIFLWFSPGVGWAVGQLIWEAYFAEDPKR